VLRAEYQSIVFTHGKRSTYWYAFVRYAAWVSSDTPPLLAVVL
jgi:hypothetical protein